MRGLVVVPKWQPNRRSKHFIEVEGRRLKIHAVPGAHISATATVAVAVAVAACSTSTNTYFIFES